MIKKNKRFKMGFLEKDLLINNFYSEVDFCKPKKTVFRFMALGFLLVIALVSGIGTLSMLAADDSIGIDISVNILPPPSGYTPPPEEVVPNPAAITSFFATPASVASGGSSELSWTSSSNTTSCTASTTFPATDWADIVPRNSTPGSYIVVPPSNPGSYDYTLTCDGVSDFVTINVALPPEIVSFFSNPISVKPSEVATLSWQVNGADSCLASGAGDWTGIVGSIDNTTYSKVITLLNSEGSYRYTLTCTNDFGSISKFVDISVSSEIVPVEPVEPVEPVTNPIETPGGEPSGGGPTPGGAPSSGPSYATFGSPGGIEITITTSNTEVPADYSGPITFSWSSKGADSCVASGVPGWTGDKAVSGSELLQNPGQVGTYTYVLICENGSGQKTTAYAKLSVVASTQPIQSAPIEGVVNIIERELTSQPTAGQDQSDMQLVVAPPSDISGVSDVLDKTGVTQAFSVSSKKSPWQNTASIIVLLAILALIGKGIYDLYSSRKNRGLVFNAQDNKPIADAKIELRKASNNQIVQTILTDHKGRFKFKLADLANGQYYVDVSKANYAFPSKLFSDKAGAGKLDKNNYLGKNFKLIKKNGLRLKIPVDLAINK